MKKLSATFIALFIFTSAFSQTEIKKRFIGGNISFYNSTNTSENYSNTSDIETTRFQFYPRYGYFISDNIAIGGNLIFRIYGENFKYKYGLGTPSHWKEWRVKTNSKEYGLGGFIRRYRKIIDNFYFFLNGELSYTLGIEKNEQWTSDLSYVYTPENPSIKESEIRTFNASVTPGLQYFINPRIGIETTFGSLYYTNSHTKDKDVPEDRNSKYDQYGISINPATFFLGFNYYF